MTREAAVQTQPAPTNHPLSQGSLLQRKCTSCGQHKTGGGTCAKRQSNDQAKALQAFPIIQTKLTVGQPNDKYEKEADRVAEQVMRMPAPETAAPVRTQFQPPKIQRMCANCEDEEKLQAKEVSGGVPEVTPAVASRIQSLQSGGQPLPTSTRNFFESRFGQDFSHVRVHSDASAQALQARAYTVGRNIVFGSGQYSPETSEGKKLLAHELTHVVQQGRGPRQSTKGSVNRRATNASEIKELSTTLDAEQIQRAGDPAALPPGLRCPPDFTPGRLPGTSLLFSGAGDSTITAAHTAILSGFLATWLASGGTNDILVHGFASTDGDQGPNWTLSCDRAKAVEAELIRLGIPAARIDVVAHGESTDFGSRPENRRVVVSMGSPGVLPLLGGVLTARDNFAGRSTTRFGVGEVVDLNFFAFPPRPAADFGGLEWQLASGGGTLTGVTNTGTATYTAPANADTVVLELRVAGGATVGRVISTHTISIVEPSGVRMTQVSGTAPNFSLGGPIPAGTWGAGFQANVFVDPKEVSFQGVQFGEGTVASVVTPPGGFQGSFVHPVNTFGPGHAGNAITGTPVSPPVDNIVTELKGPATTVLGTPICGNSDFLWAIPWEFRVAGGPRTPFAGGFTANHHATSTFFCDATIEKGGAGPFCRSINGTVC